MHISKPLCTCKEWKMYIRYTNHLTVLSNSIQLIAICATINSCQINLKICNIFQTCLSKKTNSRSECEYTVCLLLFKATRHIAARNFILEHVFVFGFLFLLFFHQLTTYTFRHFNNYSTLYMYIYRDNNIYKFSIQRALLFSVYTCTYTNKIKLYPTYYSQ